MHIVCIACRFPFISASSLLHIRIWSLISFSHIVCFSHCISSLPRHEGENIHVLVSFQKAIKRSTENNRKISHAYFYLVTAPLSIAAFGVMHMCVYRYMHMCIYIFIYYYIHPLYTFFISLLYVSSLSSPSWCLTITSIKCTSCKLPIVQIIPFLDLLWFWTHFYPLCTRVHVWFDQIKCVLPDCNCSFSYPVRIITLCPLLWKCTSASFVGYRYTCVLRFLLRFWWIILQRKTFMRSSMEIHIFLSTPSRIAITVGVVQFWSRR